MGNAGERVADQVNVRTNSIERLATVEGHQAVYSPTVGKDFRAVGGTGDVPCERGREVVSRVEVAIAVLSLVVGAVERERASIGGNLVERVRPGVNELRSQSVPCTKAQGGLQGVVVGRADAVELVDAPVVRELALVRQCSIQERLIDVQHDRELTALAAHVTHLPNRHPVAEAFLDVQVVVKEVGCAEVLVDGEYVENRCSAVRVGDRIAG